MKQDKPLGNAVIRVLKRTSSEKAENNKMRTDLLNALCNTFNVEGTAEQRMNQLEELLGDDFKRSDFGVVGDKFAATSGKPLTARRLRAIMGAAHAKAIEMNKAEGKNVAEPPRKSSIDTLREAREVHVTDKFFKPITDFLGKEQTFTLAGDVKDAQHGVTSKTFTSPLKSEDLDKKKVEISSAFRHLFELPTSVQRERYNDALDRVANLIRDYASLPDTIKYNYFLDKDGKKVDGSQYASNLIKDELEKIIANYNKEFKHTGITHDGRTNRYGA